MDQEVRKGNWNTFPFLAIVLSAIILAVPALAALDICSKFHEEIRKGEQK